MKLTIESIDAGRGSEVHHVYTDHVNWTLLRDDDGITLIDAGYPGHADLVVDSIRMIGGTPEAVVAGLLTHAHVDHIGGLAKLAGRYGFPVYTDETEVAHARREHLEQAGPLDIARMAYRPRAISWLVEVLPLGVLSRAGVDDAQGVAASVPLDLPGRPVLVPSHGHTSGHAAFLVADGRGLVSGDALITGHRVSGMTGPQRIPRGFDHDRAEAAQALIGFTHLDSDLLLPGHGPFMRVPVAQAAEQALSQE